MPESECAYLSAQAVSTPLNRKWDYTFTNALTSAWPLSERLLRELKSLPSACCWERVNLLGEWAGCCCYDVAVCVTVGFGCSVTLLMGGARGGENGWPSPCSPLLLFNTLISWESHCRQAWRFIFSTTSNQFCNLLYSAELVRCIIWFQVYHQLKRFYWPWMPWRQWGSSCLDL